MNHGTASLEVEATATPGSSPDFQLDHRRRRGERNKFTVDVQKLREREREGGREKIILVRLVIPSNRTCRRPACFLFVTVVVLIVVVSGDFFFHQILFVDGRSESVASSYKFRIGSDGGKRALAMPGKLILIQEETRGGESAMEIVENESGGFRSRSFRKKQMNNSNRFSDPTRKRFKRRVNQWPPAAFSEFESDAENDELVYVFRQVLVARELLQPRLEDYRLMKRYLKAGKYDIEKAVKLWKKEYGIDSLLKGGNCDVLAPCRSGKSVPYAPQVESSVSTNRVADKLSSCQDFILYGGSSPQNFLLRVTRFVVQLLLKFFAVLQFAISIFGRTVSVPPAKCNVHSGDCSLDNQLAAKATKSSIVPLYLQRLQKLESLVTELSKKPVEMPFDKDNMLSESLGRIKSIEYDLQKTKKVLHATASKQLELAESLEALKETNGRKRRLCWPSDCKHLNAGS
ncbi:hypothetical protein H6P81_012548 [Aristolochia fimbriata]|uniref:Uncharacterized protein n=1 Tax=Aristolochia fimbriata TaxID=158543 RepID=A0AAV7EC45_ARIFI|nr:hypothetical protein H6P81_012548 [Aristolochia fimbriata]